MAFKMLPWLVLASTFNVSLTTLCKHFWAWNSKLLIPVLNSLIYLYSGHINNGKCNDSVK